MIVKLEKKHRNQIKMILINTGNFTEIEVDAGMEVIDEYLDQDMNDIPLNNDGVYEGFVDIDEEVKIRDFVNGFVIICKRPLTFGVYDLYWIAVNPKTQSKGIGTALIQYVEKLLKSRGANLIVLETSGKPSYAKERYFYEKNGYKIFANIGDFYQKNDSLVIYGKYLS